MAEMTCPHCGASVDGEAVYCPNCTRVLRLSPAEPPAAWPTTSRSNRTIGWIIGIALLGICLLSAVPLVAMPLVQQRKEAQVRRSSSSCLSNIKQVSTATMIYMADWDDRVFVGPTYQAALMPYAKNSTIFYCPDTMSQYAVNKDVLKVHGPKVKDPANTVLFYEGFGGSLHFPHGGTGYVSFMDSHAKAVKSGGASSLNWKP